MTKPVKIALYCVCAVLLAVSGWKIADILIGYLSASSAYDDTADSALTAVTEFNSDKLTAPFEVDFEALWEESDSIIGWIYCKGTEINYPIVQSDDNSYFVRRLPNGKSGRAGSIFMDFRCASDYSDRNTIIYGHNMKNGSMFATLKKYSKQSFYDEHPIMWIYTPEEVYVLELIAGYVTSRGSESFEVFAEESEVKEYVEYSVGKSTFKSKFDTESIERVVTLATCSYEYDTARYVLVGNLVPIDEAELSQTDI